MQLICHKSTLIQTVLSHHGESISLLRTMLCF